jgi:TnpA family transposase
MRDIKERRLYLLPDQKAPTSLKPLVGGVIDTAHITAHWDQLLWLTTSIRTGTTTCSAMLKKLSAYPCQRATTRSLLTGLTVRSASPWKTMVGTVGPSPLGCIRAMTPSITASSPRARGP